MNLYKYTSASLWGNILKDKLIRFTPPIVFNDPFEMQPFYEPLRDNTEIQKHMNEAEVKAMLEEALVKEHLNLPAEMQEALPVEFLMACAEIWSPFAVEHAPTILDGFMPIINNALFGGFNENIGVLSLSEKCDNLLMWAHYAQSHSGLVIGFDGEHEYFHQQLGSDDEFRYIRKVRYSDIRPRVDLTTIEDAADIFLTKSREWEYEQEWRIMRPLQDATEVRSIDNQTIHLFSFPPTCVREVILGYRISALNRLEIRESLANDEQYSHVKLYDAVIDIRDYKVNMVPTEI